MTVVHTNLGNTRERAAQIRFEPVGGILATNVQDAIAEAVTEGLTALTTPTVVTASGTIAATAVMVQTNQAGAITLTLPSSVLWAAQNSKYGLPLSIFDMSGTGSTNNVTLNTTGGQTISGLASGALAIMTDYGGFRLEPKSGGGWIIV